MKHTKNRTDVQNPAEVIFKVSCSSFLVKFKQEELEGQTQRCSEVKNSFLMDTELLIGSQVVQTYLSVFKVEPVKMSE